MIPYRAIGWTTGAGTAIDLVRKDLHANIESIDFQLIDKENHIVVAVEVTYAPDRDRKFFFTHRCIRGLINIKLAVLKQDLDTNKHYTGWEPALI